MSEFTPPRALSIEPGSRHFHPSFRRVGVRIDGVEVSDCWYYNLDRGEYRRGSRHGELLRSDAIEPYIRITAESRQERRARERWEAKHPRAEEKR